MNCSICQNEIQAVGDWTQGNNAEPVNDGRCCDQCNATVVIPARLTQMRRRIPPVVAKTHTPGPWHSHYSTAVAEQADGECVAATAITDVESGVYELSGIRGNLIAFVPHDERHEANARLIAAAPMLLQTMAGVLKQMKDGGYFEDSVVGRWAYCLESAIKRAEGRAE
jgi:hypothetical protein